MSDELQDADADQYLAPVFVRLRLNLTKKLTALVYQTCVFYFIPVVRAEYESTNN